MPKKNMVGAVIGPFTLICVDTSIDTGTKSKFYRYKCGLCGSIKSANITNFRKMKSCGCQQFKEKPNALSRNALYWILQGIKSRCFNRNHEAYKHYGGRGITLYKPWVDDFDAFLAYVSKLPHFPFSLDGATRLTDLEIDRKDNEKGYVPGNIRWANRPKQLRNYSRNHVLYNEKGERINLMDISIESGVKYGTLLSRVYSGDKSGKLAKMGVFLNLEHINAVS